MKKTYKEVVEDAKKAFPIDEELLKSLPRNEAASMMLDVIGRRKEYIRNEATKRILDS